MNNRKIEEIVEKRLEVREILTLSQTKVAIMKLVKPNDALAIYQFCSRINALSIKDIKK